MAESEYRRLGSDAGYFADLARSDLSVLARAADENDPHRACYLLALTDLFWQVQQYAGAVHILAQDHLHLPLLVAQRGLFESAVAMAYLTRHPKADFEGTVLLAYSYLKDLEEHPEQADLQRDRAALLARMPEDAVDAARKRMRQRPHTWSGLSLRQLVTKAGMRGYDEFYGPLSGSAHAARAGRYFRIIAQDGNHQVVTGWHITDEEREVYSNFARRILHGAFKMMWSTNGGNPIHLDTTDPDAWVHASAD